MAKFVLTDATVTVNGVNLSDHVQSVAIEENAPEVDVTSMGASYMQFQRGIRDATITVTYFQDFASGSVDSVHNGLWSAGTAFSVVIKPTSAAVSATNPTYTMATALMFSWSPMGGAVGDASQTEVTYRNNGTAGIVRATA